MARVGRIISTTAFKLSAIYLAVFTASALVFVLSINLAANQFLTRQINDAIDTEFLDLSAAWNAGGVLALVDAINERSRRPGASLYLLADGSGRILAGNVSEVSTEFLARAIQDPAVVVYHGADNAERSATVQVVRLPGSLYLLVGRDLAEHERFASLTRTALVSAGALLVALGLVSWFFVSRRVLRRIDSVSATSQLIMSGDLSGRLEVTGTNDEFDRLATSLNAMLARIEGLMRGLKEVSDNIAHDLRTPLNRLRNRLEAAAADTTPAAAHETVIKEAIEDADQMMATFDALLTIARIEAGAVDETMAEVDAAAAVRDVVELYQPVAEEAWLALRLSGEGPLTFRGSRELLSQAVANLIDNAIKHGRPEAEGESPATIDVSAVIAGGELIISVADHGPGIPEADRERVFQRFVRLEKSRSAPGTGLGLSLVAALVRLHRGRLTLGDNGPGLVATMWLPLTGPVP